MQAEGWVVGAKEWRERGLSVDNADCITMHSRKGRRIGPLFKVACTYVPPSSLRIPY